jgi:aconitate hydratase
MSEPINKEELKDSFKHEGEECSYYSLERLQDQLGQDLSGLPISVRILLESLIRNYDGETITSDHIESLAGWSPDDPGEMEVPFHVSRVLMQDFTGVPAVVDLAAMRSCLDREGEDPNNIQPDVPVDLVIDHSIQVDSFGVPEALDINTKREFERNEERYRFLKWGRQGFDDFTVVPPKSGIVHQVNLEYLGQVVMQNEQDGENLCYPDTLVGTDSHTPMINGLGVLGFGVGGIEAEAGLLGEPVIIPAPEVVGFRMTGELRKGVTATDLVLTVTDILRQHDVVSKFVEFYGEGVEKLTLPDRATLGNMTPEYGATVSLSPVDEETLNYMELTGRDEEHVELVGEYMKRQGLFGVPKKDDVEYSMEIELDLSEVDPCVAGPKLPQERIELGTLRDNFENRLNDAGKSLPDGSSEPDVAADQWSDDGGGDGGGVAVKTGSETKIDHGDVVIAAITSCTNTSNPSVMMGAGLLAQNAVEAGLEVPDYVKTSLAPGSRVVTKYLEESELLPSLEELGFGVVAYGCTTCIGNSGPLPEEIEKQIKERDLHTASVLSGNRNFEARIHNLVRENYLMSPPLVVAFALAGTIDIDMENDPLGEDKNGNPIFLDDIWPTQEQIQDTIHDNVNPDMYREQYADIFTRSEEWNELEAPEGTLYDWQEDSTYIQEPPFFTGDFDPYEPPGFEDIENARTLLVLPDNVTTDHISPAGQIPEDTPAGQYLKEQGVEPHEFNSYGSRRGNDRVMTRGTFANVRINNLMVPGKEGGYTKHMPDGEEMTVYEAAMKYKEDDVPLIVVGGKNYGSGSSRDWAAKGTDLLGVDAVVATSYERIHRVNLLCMGVVPLQFPDGENPESLGLQGNEVYDLIGLEGDLEPGQTIQMSYTSPDGREDVIDLTLRLDTPTEVKYCEHAGVLDYVIRKTV